VQVLFATRAPERFDRWVWFLEREGLHVVRTRPEPDLLRDALRRRLPDVALLDLSGSDSPERDCRRLLAACPGSSAAFIAVVARVSSLSAELDDVLHTSAPAEEALYRIRRAAQRRAPPAVESEGLVVPLAEARIAVEGRPVTLRARELALLRFLVAHPNRVFRREELLRAVWGPEYRGSVRSVDACVRRLRAALGAHAGRLQTVRGVGYRFAAAGLRDV
jgi:DNA-binding response OmpR family regulator